MATHAAASPSGLLFQLGSSVLEQVQEVTGRSLDDAHDLARALLDGPEQHRQQLFPTREVGHRDNLLGVENVALEEAEEQTEFDVVMTSYGAKKIGVIKVVRGITSKGLKEAKELVESVPCKIGEALPKAEADELKAKLEEAGAVVEVK